MIQQNSNSYDGCGYIWCFINKKSITWVFPINKVFVNNVFDTIFKQNIFERIVMYIVKRRRLSLRPTRKLKNHMLMELITLTYVFQYYKDQLEIMKECTQCLKRSQ